MLKTIKLPDKLALSKNNSSRSVSSKNDNSKPVFEKNDDDDKVERFGINRNSIAHVKKLEKLSKLGKLSMSRKLKSSKTFKSQNLTKLGKKLLKGENSTNFDITKAIPKFLTSNARTAFNCL